MKVDKQQLIKHHFWILLGVFALFALILIILVPTLVGDEITAKVIKIEAVKKELQGNSNPKTDAFTKELDKQFGQLDGRKDSLWREMFARQQEIVVFPGEMNAKLKDLKFGDDINADWLKKYRESNVYQATYDEMATMIKPTEFSPKWDAVLKPVSWKVEKLPSSEEVWLSLEDLCVRREILNIVREANKLPAAFTEVAVGPKDAPLPQTNLGKDLSKRFESRWYQVDLAVKDNTRGSYTFSGKVKNVSGRRRKIYNLSLKVWLRHDLPGIEARPVILNFPLDFLGADEQRNLTEVTVQLNQAPEKLLRLELNHSLETVPIKYVEQIAFGPNAAGHRMYKNLQTAKWSKAEAKTSTSSSGFTGPGGASPMGGMGGMAGGPSGTGGGTSMTPGASGAGGGDDKTVHGVSKNRYIEVTSEVRRIPVAVVMVADQAHMQDVLTAFTNSIRMRFQITHYHWERAYLTPAASSESSDGPPAKGSTGPMSPGPMGGGAGFGLAGSGTAGGGGATPPIGPGFGGGVPGAAQGPSFAEQPPMTLIEMTVYGIANIYERPGEAKPGTTASPTKEPTPTTPNPMSPTSPKQPDQPVTNPATSTKPGPAEKPPASGQPKTTPEKPATPGTKPADPSKKPGDSKSPAPGATPDKAKPDAPKPPVNPEKGKTGK